MDYLIVSLSDSIWAEKKQKKVELKEFEASGTIYSSLSKLGKLKIKPFNKRLSEIYAWNIDFFRLKREIISK